MIGQFRAVTKDTKEVVYGCGIFKACDEWYLNQMPKKSNSIIIDPASLAFLVNGEEVEKEYKKTINGEMIVVDNMVYRDREKDYYDEQLALEKALKVARYASYYQLGFGMTRGGDVLENTYGEIGELIFHEYCFQIKTSHGERVQFCEAIEANVIGNAYLNPELLKGKND